MIHAVNNWANSQFHQARRESELVHLEVSKKFEGLTLGSLTLGDERCKIFFFLMLLSTPFVSFSHCKGKEKTMFVQEEYDYWLPLAYKCFRRWTTFENKPSYNGNIKREYNHHFLIFEKKVGFFTSIYNNTFQC